MEKKKKSFIIIALSLSVLSIVFLGVIFYMVSNPKTIVLQSVNHLVKNTKSIVQNVDNKFYQSLMENDQIKISSNITLGQNDEESDLALNLTYLENKKNAKSSLLLSLSQQESLLLEIKGILAENKLYLKVTDIMNYYYTNSEYFSLFEDRGSVNYEKIIDIFRDQFVAEIERADIKKSKETISLGDKNKKTTKLSYAVSEKMLATVLSNTLVEIQKDKDLMKELSLVFDETEKDFRKQILDTLDQLKKVKEDILFHYNVYYYGFNNIVMNEIVDQNTSIQMYQYDSGYEFKLLDDNQDIFSVKLIPGKNETKISGSLQTYTFTGSLTNQNDNTKLKLQVNLTKEKPLFVEIEDSMVEKNNQYLSKFKMTYYFDKENKTNIKMNTTYSFGEKVDTSEIVDAKSFDEITEEEFNAILTNLQNHPFLSIIYSMVSPYLLGDSANGDI